MLPLAAWLLWDALLGCSPELLSWVALWAAFLACSPGLLSGWLSGWLSGLLSSIALWIALVDCSLGLLSRLLSWMALRIALLDCSLDCSLGCLWLCFSSLFGVSRWDHILIYNIQFQIFLSVRFLAALGSFCQFTAVPGRPWKCSKRQFKQR